jgi:hypothetical protein
MINGEGYRARYRVPYRPDQVMTNRYLEIGGWCYWFIYPEMLNGSGPNTGSTSRSPTRATVLR